MNETFQQEVDRWLIACFGEEIARDKVERNHRFIEEALELVQSGGCTRSEAHQLVDYVFDRPVGDMWQEVGGVMNTLAALCLAYDLDMVECGNREIARCWTKVEKIRAKQAAKPKHSPLPEHVAAPASAEPVKVKPLKWSDASGEEYAIRWNARSPAGVSYVARAVRTSDMILCAGRYYSTIDEAKAAAQTDFEQRIRSALTAEPASAAEPDIRLVEKHRNDLAFLLSIIDGLSEATGEALAEEDAAILAEIREEAGAPFGEPLTIDT